MRHIILGSGSVSRRKIITEMGLSYIVHSADIDEKAIGDRSSSLYANDLVLSIAVAKANHIMKNLPSKLFSKFLLTADTVVTHKGLIFEKPQTADEVRSNYNSFGSAPCSVVNAIVITDVSTGARVQVNKCDN
jgi:septum formation protein